jgi:hypothetical protein
LSRRNISRWCGRPLRASGCIRMWYEPRKERIRRGVGGSRSYLIPSWKSWAAGRAQTLPSQLLLYYSIMSLHHSIILIEILTSHQERRYARNWHLNSFYQQLTRATHLIVPWKENSQQPSRPPYRMNLQLAKAEQDFERWKPLQRTPSMLDVQCI